MRAVVVGAGVSGAFAADTLRRRLGPDVELDVLEREARTGGRVFRRAVSGVELETGASLFHSSNRLIAGSARDLGLDVVPAGSGGGLGIWDGTRLVVRDVGNRRADMLRLLARYGIPLVRAGRQVAALVRQLDAVYPRLGRGDAWDGPDALWSDLGLDALARRRAQDHFPSGRFLAEFVDGVSRNNYAQDSGQLNALVDLVSLAGAGLGGGTLQRVARGNAAVPAGLLARSGARVQKEAAVARVQRSGRAWRVDGDGFAPLEADVVVLAAPLELSDIELVGAPIPPPRSYVCVHVTFVVGPLRRDALGAGTPPTFTLTTAAAGSVLSIQHVAGTAQGPLYKVFSTEELADDRVDRFFAAAEVTRMRWFAYPGLAPAPAPVFRLAPGLYYTGAMEYAVSTMETQAIGGVATANLAARDHR